MLSFNESQVLYRSKFGPEITPMSHLEKKSYYSVDIFWREEWKIRNLNIFNKIRYVNKMLKFFRLWI